VFEQEKAVTRGDCAISSTMAFTLARFFFVGDPMGKDRR